MPDVQTPAQLKERLEKAAIATAISTNAANRLDIVKQAVESGDIPTAQGLLGNPAPVTGQNPGSNTSGS